MPLAPPRHSPVEDALVDWLLARPPSAERLRVEVLSATQAAGELQRLQARKAAAGGRCGHVRRAMACGC